MPINFDPNYQISPKTTGYLMKIEAVKEQVLYLPMNPIVLSSLRETARLYTTHYSTMIEGNELEPDQVNEVLKHEGHFPGREQEEHEVKGYYTALTHVEKWAAKKITVTENHIQMLHALVMSNGRVQVKPTSYRDGQNVIRDGRSKTIIYMPPEAKDVSALMLGLVEWINNNELPAPIVAAIAHYQFATIHPYYDGNGRVARLLTTLILYLGGYDLKGVYSLEEYYARNLSAYYEAISIGKSHNYYMGRAEADITKWIDYFIEGMLVSFNNVLKHMQNADKQGVSDLSILIRKMDPKQRKALELFQEYDAVTSRQIGELFGFKPRTSAALCSKWVKLGFFTIVNPSNKARSYALADAYKKILEGNF